MRWAVIDLNTNTVENVIIWDGISVEVLPYSIDRLVQLEETEWCDMLANYDATAKPRFSPALVPEEI
jgi:hypothetical protein